jgi:hypothetical protein
MLGAMPNRPGHLAAIVALAVSAAASADLTPDRVLLLYNSQNAESLAIRDAYVAAHPGVLEFDLNDATLGAGQITRSAYLNRVRAPLRAHLATTDDAGVPLAQRVLAIATTRGTPARINGANEFNIDSTHASVESELTLLWQDLEQAGTGALPFRYSGIIDNPYHTRRFRTIDSFDRSQIAVERSFSYTAPGAWSITGLTPGDMYLVCRLDAAPLGAASAVDNTIALINRSVSLSVDPCEVQALLDEHSCAEQLDDDEFTALFPGRDDFAQARNSLLDASILTTHDETAEFITGDELPAGPRVLVLATYGENHDVNNCGDDPAGDGTYLDTYDYHPAAFFVSYESFNGNSIATGAPRQNQAQALDFIALGGSFSIAHQREPFTFAVADAEWFVRNFYLDGMSFAEAAYTAIPGLSWQNTPIGDPLARVTLGPSLQRLDIDMDGRFTVGDLHEQNEQIQDADCDDDADLDDLRFIRDQLRVDEVSDLLTGN